MNLWLLFAAIFMLMLVPCIWVCLTTRIMERFISLQMAQILSVIVMILLAQGYGRDIYFDMGLVLAVLSLASGLVYIRFLERWL
jgi:multicomponent Na+:H+ antiporter subunit F